jgi:hypothetical protein
MHEDRLSDPPRSTLRARWTLAAAVLVSVLLVLGATTLLRRDDPPDPPVSLPGPWEPPTLAATAPSVPIVSDPVTSPGTTTPEDEPERSPTTRPTTSAPAPPPVTPTLSVSQGGVPATVDVSGEGSRDWVHFGLTSASSVNRRSGGTGEIRDNGGSPRGRYDNNLELFSWSGGTPTRTASRTNTGVYACGRGSGFTLSVPASTTTRTLRLYAGVWQARGRLSVSVAGRTASAELENRRDITTNRFVIRFRAPAGQSLRVTWTATEVFNATCGNVDMQAATLS